MASFKSVKLMSYNSLPTNTSDTDVYAVPTDISTWEYAPNYGAQVGLSTGTTYTVGSGALASYSKGYLLAGCTSRSDDSAPNLYFNGIQARLMGYDGDYGGDLSGYCIFIPAKSGDWFRVEGSQGGPIVRFVPTKG